MWFAQNKATLQSEFPDLIAAELTKQAMRRYKAMKADGKDLSAGVVSHKRKLTDDAEADAAPIGDGSDMGAKVSSGVAKLARFGFAKI